MACQKTRDNQFLRLDDNYIAERALSSMVKANDDRPAHELFVQIDVSNLAVDQIADRERLARETLDRMLRNYVRIEKIADELRISVRTIKNFLSGRSGIGAGRGKTNSLVAYILWRQRIGQAVDRMPREARASRPAGVVVACDWNAYMEHADRCRIFPESYIAPWAIESDEMSQLLWMARHAAPYFGRGNDRTAGYAMRQATNFYYALLSAIDKVDSASCDRESLVYYRKASEALQCNVTANMKLENDDVVEKNTNLWGASLLHFGVLLDNKEDRQEGVENLTSNLDVDYSGREVHAMNVWIGHDALARRHPDEAEQYLERIEMKTQSTEAMHDLASGLGEVNVQHTQAILNTGRFTELRKRLRQAASAIGSLAFAVGPLAQLLMEGGGVGCR